MRDSHPQLLLDLGVSGARVLGDFVAGDNAELVQRLTRCGRSGFECLWLHGPGGTGKSHLLQGACRQVADSGAPAAYLPGSIADTAPESALMALAGLEGRALVAIDDLESWVCVAGVEEALVGIYQDLLAAAGVFLVASRHGPAQFDFSLPDLGSRLRGAASYPLCEPGDSGKLQVLLNVAETRGLIVSTEVANYLLTHAARDMAGLLTSLDRLEQAAATRHRRLTIPLVKQVLDL